MSLLWSTSHLASGHPGTPSFPSFAKHMQLPISTLYKPKQKPTTPGHPCSLTSSLEAKYTIFEDEHFLEGARCVVSAIPLSPSHLLSHILRDHLEFLSRTSCFSFQVGFLSFTL